MATWFILPLSHFRRSRHTTTVSNLTTTNTNKKMCYVFVSSISLLQKGQSVQCCSCGERLLTMWTDLDVCWMRRFKSNCARSLHFHLCIFSMFDLSQTHHHTQPCVPIKKNAFEIIRTRQKDPSDPSRTSSYMPHHVRLGLQQRLVRIFWTDAWIGTLNK